MKPIVEINNSFQRSINISYDLETVSILDSIIPNITFNRVLEDLANRHDKDGQAAFTWTGPYGSGKSLLSLLLMSFLSQDDTLLDTVKSKISKEAYSNLENSFICDKKWNILPITGRKESIDDLLKFGLKSKKIRFTKDPISSIKNYIKNNKLCIIIDEMGKSLEHSAEFGNDIYILQELAELANRTKNLVFVGILHQSVSEYARDLPYSIRDEWSKIQGRFSDYTINTSNEEQLVLISKTIKRNEEVRISKTF